MTSELETTKSEIETTSEIEPSVCGCVRDTSGCICGTWGCEQCNEYFGLPGLVAPPDKNNSGYNNQEDICFKSVYYDSAAPSATIPRDSSVFGLDEQEIEETWSICNGFKISNSIPLNWEWSERNSNRGPSHCETCRVDGMFEDVFYGLCIKCCAISEPCPCVFCRMAEKDEHKRMERRTNMCNFIKTIQLVVDDLRREYPADEYGIVQEAIDSGFYILNLHTKRQYEKMMNEACLPTEVSQLPNRDLSWRWNPKMDIPPSVREAALKAADRMKCEQTPEYSASNYIELVAVKQYCTKLEYNEDDPTQYSTCDNCSTWMWNHSGDMCDKCIESHMRDMDEYDIQCKECGTWVSTKEIDARNYCLDCQNPEYDPVWPMGD
jgi:hypothetical protein